MQTLSSGWSCSLHLCKKLNRPRHRLRLCAAAMCTRDSVLAAGMALALPFHSWGRSRLSMGYNHSLQAVAVQPFHWTLKCWTIWVWALLCHLLGNPNLPLLVIGIWSVRYGTYLYSHKWLALGQPTSSRSTSTSVGQRADVAPQPIAWTSPLPSPLQLPTCESSSWKGHFKIFVFIWGTPANICD